MAITIDNPRLPAVLTVDYTFRDYEVVDYANYCLDSMPRLRFRGPRFDPREAAPGSFFTAFGSAHTLGTFSPVTYPALLAEKLGMAAWNVGVGGISASFYNNHPAIIDYANRGKFAVVQLTAARMEGNDRFATLPAAQMVLDTRHGDIISPEGAWARISREEPDKFEAYAAQSRATWAEQHRKLLEALTVPVILLWFSARPMDASGEAITQVGSLASTSFPQFVNGEDVAKVRGLADAFVECTSSRGADYPLVSRFTGQPVSINHKLLGPHGGGVDFFDARNSYYPSPEMQEDAAAALLPEARKLSA